MNLTLAIYERNTKEMFLGIYCPLIPDWIELTRAQGLFPHQIHKGDTEPNSKYYLEEYLNIS